MVFLLTQCDTSVVFCCQSKIKLLLVWKLLLLAGAKCLLCLSFSNLFFMVKKNNRSIAILTFCLISVHETLFTIEVSKCALTAFGGFIHPRWHLHPLHIKAVSYLQGQWHGFCLYRPWDLGPVPIWVCWVGCLNHGHPMGAHTRNIGSSPAHTSCVTAELWACQLPHGAEHVPARQPSPPLTHLIPPQLCACPALDQTSPAATLQPPQWIWCGSKPISTATGYMDKTHQICL